MSIDTQAYLFVHFIGEERNPTDEQLYFALSRDGVHWRDLRPAGSPALTWLGGEKGVRDPHIVRDPRGGFHIVATDLSIYYRGGWGPNDGATTNGSTGLVIWASTGLEDSGRWHGLGSGGELGSGSRAVDCVLVHEEQRRKLRGSVGQRARRSDECVLCDDR